MTASLNASRESIRNSGFELSARERQFISAAVMGQSIHRDLIATGRLELRGESLDSYIGSTTSGGRMIELQMRGRVGIPHLSFSAGVDVARLTMQDGERDVRSRVELGTMWHSGTHRIQSSIAYETGPTLFVSDASSNLSFRLGGEEQLSHNLSFRLDLIGSSLRAPATHTSVTGRAALEYRFSDGKRLSAESVTTLQRGLHSDLQTDYRLTFELPLHANNPLPLRGSIVDGVVFDQVTGVGIPNVLVTLGNESTLTDTDGRFAVRKPEVGIYHLYIDRVSLGLDRVPAVSVPMLISIPAEGSLDFIRIPVSRRSELKGEVRLLDIRGGAGTIRTDSVDVGPARHAVVEIASSELRYRQLVQRDGTFSFSDLPPGEWTIRVLEPSLPDGFLAEQAAHIVSLPTRDTVRLNLISDSRPTHMLGGEVQRLRGTDSVLRVND